MLPLSTIEPRSLLGSWDEVCRASLAGNHCRGMLIDEARRPSDGRDEWADEHLTRMCRDFAIAVVSSPLAAA